MTASIFFGVLTVWTAGLLAGWLMRGWSDAANKAKRRTSRLLESVEAKRRRDGMRAVR